MSVLLSPVGNGINFLNSDGIPLVGGKIYTYQAGSSTPLDTYTDVNGTIANTNPIVLGTDGRTPNEIWLTYGYSYKFVIKDASDVTIQTLDNLYGILQTAPASAPTIPSGCIILWSGASGAIPVGYYLCDGNNGTPDLRNRFIVGAGDAYSVNQTGGSADSITVAHTHTATTASNGAHQHFMFNTEVNINGSDPSASNYISKSGVVNGSSGLSYAEYALSASGTGATVGLTSSNGAHTHTLTTDSTGTSGTNANLPPYFALCYIMKS